MLILELMDRTKQQGVEHPVIYRYTSGLHLDGDAPGRAAANVAYGIVVLSPEVFDGEYVKSSSQYHSPTPPSNLATPEIYTVLPGTGLFLLQKARPPKLFPHAGWARRPRQGTMTGQ